MPSPKVTVITIRDIVEAEKGKSDPNYTGHDRDQIASLYSSIRIFKTDNLAREAAWSTFFRICVAEAEQGESWIDSKLAKSLIELCQLHPERIPYNLLCASIFDGNPANFFLSMYRCLEALYAYAPAQTLVTKLNVSIKWSDVALILEEDFNWRPKEESALQILLTLADDNDLKNLIREIERSKTICLGKNYSETASKKLYLLRNNIVRPVQQKVDLDSYNWNEICRLTASILAGIYLAPFSS